ncbi:DUF1848 domain-containing protein [Enterocloster aldenensis]|uniref:DUF1848 domain-containing protein n=1 Tax=Enterocloster aldenensis TaxID=358742 RepID=UPI000E4E4CB8|nr:DUF1848 domain-containing protein [Enterocloster aldenensis]
MILSVSRRTDIPAFYSDWFFNRLKAGFVCVRNPMYPEKVSKISMDKEVIDCIVFWTKNVKPMLDRLDELDGYNYYFQYTLNPYGTDVEPIIGINRNTNIETMIHLSERIGADKVIWRYDPIFTSQKYTKDYHIKSFKKMAESLRGYTLRVVISFLDLYGQTKRNMPDIDKFDETEYRDLVRQLVQIAKDNGMIVESCAEKIDLPEEGVMHGHCIDKDLIEEIVGYRLTGGKDKGQRQECGCMESIDIGVYNTCKNGCKYCYAMYGEKDVVENIKAYNPESPILCGIEMPTDIVTERNMRSLKRKR